MISIRSMAQSDVGAVAEMEAETLSPWSTFSLENEILAVNGLQFVAEMTPEIVGWCSCRLIAPEAELFKITVKQECRRQGVASSLLAWLIKELRSKNIEKLFLEVRAANMEGKSFYQHHGFSQVGVRAGYYSNPPDNALIFCKTIIKCGG